MGLRTLIGNQLMSGALGTCAALGLEPAVDAGGTTLDIKMAVPEADDDTAWDDSLYYKGNLFVGNYANPIKPDVIHNGSIEEADEITAVSGGELSIQRPEDAHIEMMSSARYKLGITMNTISQLINPSERLTKIQWAIIALAGMMLLTLVVNVAVAARVGVF